MKRNSNNRFRRKKNNNYRPREISEPNQNYQSPIFINNGDFHRQNPSIRPSHFYPGQSNSYDPNQRQTHVHQHQKQHQHQNQHQHRHRQRNQHRQQSHEQYQKKYYSNSRNQQECSFFSKIGACRHGSACSRRHVKAKKSQTIILYNIYEHPFTAYQNVNDKNIPKGRKSFFERKSGIDIALELFYMDIFEEASKFGAIEEIAICDNLSAHLVGNVYIKYFSESDASKAKNGLNQRFYDGRVVRASLSPSSNFSDARCNKFHDISLRKTGCDRKGDCNFLHYININPELVKVLKQQQISMKQGNLLIKEQVLIEPQPTQVEARKRLRLS